MEEMTSQSWKRKGSSIVWSRELLTSSHPGHRAYASAYHYQMAERRIPGITTGKQ